MQSDSRALVKSLINLAYFMRGAVTYDEMFFKTYGEREIFKEFLDERFEIEKSRGVHAIY